MEEIIKQFPNLTDNQLLQFQKLEALYHDWNAKINVISRKDINLLFCMVGLSVSEDVCWLIHEVIKCHSKKKGKFSVEDAEKLVVKRKELFDETL